MNQLNRITPHAYWLAARFAKQLGIIGLLGLALIMASLAFLDSQYFPMKHALFQAQQQLVQAQSEQAISPIVQVTAPQNSATEFYDFYASFPTRAHLSPALKIIQQTALKHKLTLNRGDYKFTLSPISQTKNQDIARYEIQLPMSGTYTQMRAFMDEVMQQLPTLALTDLQLKRENIATPAVEARVTFTYFLRNGT